MADETEKPPLSAADFTTIEAAVMETARGRWFLAEFAKRNRHAETQALLVALGKLELAVAEMGLARAENQAPQSESTPLRSNRADLLDELADIRRLLLNITGSGNSSETSAEFARSIANHSTDARDAAIALVATVRDVASIADKFTAAGGDAKLASELSSRARSLALIGELGSITARRLTNLVNALTETEERLAALLGVEKPLPAPAAIEPSPVVAKSEPPTALAKPPQRATPPAPATTNPAPPAQSNWTKLDETRPRPTLADLQKMSPLERLKALS